MHTPESSSGDSQGVTACPGTLGTPGQGGAPREPPSCAPRPTTTAYLAVLAHAPDEQRVLQGHIEAPAGDADVWGRRGDITLGMTAPQPSVGTLQPFPAVSRIHSPHVGITPELGTNPAGRTPTALQPHSRPQAVSWGSLHPSRVGHCQVTAAVPGARQPEGWDKPGLLSLSYPLCPEMPMQGGADPHPSPYPGCGMCPSPTLTFDVPALLPDLVHQPLWGKRLVRGLAQPSPLVGG